jgi:hypothetical protein
MSTPEQRAALLDEFGFDPADPPTYAPGRIGRLMRRTLAALEDAVWADRHRAVTRLHCKMRRLSQALLALGQALDAGGAPP